MHLERTCLTTVTAAMGSTPSVEARPDVAAGKVRICIAGFKKSPNVAQAVDLAKLIKSKHNDQYELWFWFAFKAYQTKFLPALKAEPNWDESTFAKPAGGGCTNFKDHTKAPIVWLEYPGGKKEYIGGRDFFCEWAGKKFASDAEIVKLAGGEKPLKNPSPGLRAFNFDNKSGLRP